MDGVLSARHVSWIAQSMVVTRYASHSLKKNRYEKAMGILISRDTRLLIQGITGRQAHLNMRYMREYGTQVVAGVTPGKGGRFVDDIIPVYNSVKEGPRRKAEADVQPVPAR